MAHATIPARPVPVNVPQSPSKADVIAVELLGAMARASAATARDVVTITVEQIVAAERQAVARHTSPVADAYAKLVHAAKLAIKATGGSGYWHGETEAFLKLMEEALPVIEGSAV